MKISQIQIQNFRLLKDFKIDLESELSLGIGKNNCGKTSFLSLLEKFLINDLNRFSFDDFNIELQLELKKHFQYNIEEAAQGLLGVSLRLVISYDEEDNLANISPLMLDLDPDKRIVIIQFEYSLPEEKKAALKNDFLEFHHEIMSAFEKSLDDQTIIGAQRDELIALNRDKKGVLYFLKKYHGQYFNLSIKAIEPDNESNVLDITKERKLLDKVIAFRRIKAKRDVANEDGYRKPDKTLSKMSSKYYEKVSGPDLQAANIKKLQYELSSTDDKLNVLYDDIFNKIVEKVKMFGGVKKDESKLMIVSTLEERNLLSNNTTVMYNHGNNHLPEDYNGLGYLNLISMIFEIEVLISEFKNLNTKNELPSDINLLFIEEPEAHTHPQMQYVFIKNIKQLLQDSASGKDDGKSFNLQTIVTTHSSCIVAESDFNDLKYFHRATENTVIAKNLKDLQAEYTQDDPKDYQFLKQYLTLNKSELFFADKAIFIEGDTERILIPAMMRKLDILYKEEELPLLSQNISIVDVGAHAHIFEKFIDFLGIKTLIITDLDAVCEKREKCRVLEGKHTSNSTLKFFFSNVGFDDLRTLEHTKKQFRKLFIAEKDKKVWSHNETPVLSVSYQIEENGYTARSFEDAFIHLNRDFINEYKDKFKSLKNKKYFDFEEHDAYHLADQCIDKKTGFALDVLFYSDDKFSNWEIPLYINEGLLWLKK
jgi:predicted ATP-dependent endonuclease of OLD family